MSSPCKVSIEIIRALSVFTVALIVYYGQSTAPELPVSINCTGGEKRLEDCFASTDYNITAKTNTTFPVCKHAGVQCDRKCRIS